ncbi:MAG: hypothetical protein IH607_08685, partial [Firmicutes bacterium]|nr:hypothetical protein [Bacillota bacterium]
MARRSDIYDPYDEQIQQEERQYGFYWYASLWRVLRSVLIIATALVLVFGLLTGLYNYVDDNY